MLPSIPVAEFVAPKKGSRAWNAVNRAIELAPTTNVELIGELRGEKYYRVRAKGHDRHCVIRWFSTLEEQEVASCDCEAFRIPIAGPDPCFHVASVLVKEAAEPDRKQASMGTKRGHNGANPKRAGSPETGAEHC